MCGIAVGRCWKPHFSYPLGNFGAGSPPLFREICTCAQSPDSLSGCLILPIACNHWNAFRGCHHPLGSHSKITRAVSENFLAAGHVKPRDFWKASGQGRPTAIHLCKRLLEQRNAHLSVGHFSEKKLWAVTAPCGAWQVVVDFNDFPAIAAPVEELHLVLAILRSLEGSSTFPNTRYHGQMERPELSCNGKSSGFLVKLSFRRGVG